MPVPRWCRRAWVPVRIWKCGGKKIKYNVAIAADGLLKHNNTNEAVPIAQTSQLVQVLLLNFGPEFLGPSQFDCWTLTNCADELTDSEWIMLSCSGIESSRLFVSILVMLACREGFAFMLIFP